jgi:hypothetical protein
VGGGAGNPRAKSEKPAKAVDIGLSKTTDRTDVRERQIRAEAILERRWVVNTLSQRAGGDIQIPKRPLRPRSGSEYRVGKYGPRDEAPPPAKRLSSTGLYLKGRQGSRIAVLFAGPPDTTFFIMSPKGAGQDKWG